MRPPGVVGGPVGLRVSCKCTGRTSPARRRRTRPRSRGPPSRSWAPSARSRCCARRARAPRSPPLDQPSPVALETSSIQASMRASLSAGEGEDYVPQVEDPARLEHRGRAPAPSGARALRRPRPPAPAPGPSLMGPVAFGPRSSSCFARALGGVDGQRGPLPRALDLARPSPRRSASPTPDPGAVFALALTAPPPPRTSRPAGTRGSWRPSTNPRRRCARPGRARARRLRRRT